jgi:antagonist of KipI
MIHVLSAGLLTTVQDLGRYHLGPLGMPAAGAADPIALRLANRLAGNEEGTAALELTLTGGTFVFRFGAVAALAGSDFAATLDGVPMPPWTSRRIAPGQTLTLGGTRSGARCYLAVQGGILVKPVGGSASTHVPSGTGGMEGRALRSGDLLRMGPWKPHFADRAISNRALARLAPRKVLRVTPGPQADWLADADGARFYETSFRVSEHSNRMGLRLLAARPFPVLNGAAMPSEGLPVGAIQLPPSGEPILTFVDQQTTGGYPKVANVIAADLASVGQLRPRDEVRFERVTFAQARAALLDQEHLISSGEIFSV